MQRFEDLVTAGRAGEALSLWRGPPRWSEHLKSDRLRLDECDSARRPAGDELEQGRHAEVVAQARDLLAEDPCGSAASAS